MLVVLVGLFSGGISADEPVLFFSDLTSGPKTGWEGSTTKGAAVTIWGLGFGSSRGNSYVTVGGVDLISDTDYAEWGATENNAKLDAQTTQERITFWLNSNMITGAGKIKVTVDGVDSNEINFTVRESGNIFFIDKDDGVDINDGTAGIDLGGGTGPWEHFYMADPEENNALNPGDIIYVRSGTYNVPDGDGRLIKLYGTKDGTVDMPFAIIGYPGDDYPNCTEKIMYCETAGGGTQVHYYTFAKLNYIGESETVFMFHGDGWRIIGNYFDISQPSERFITILKPWHGKYHYMYGNVFKGGGYDNWGHLIYPACGAAGNDGGDLHYLYIAYNEVDNFEGDQAPNNYGGAAFNFRQASNLDDPPVTIDYVYIHHNYMHDSDYAQFLYLEKGYVRTFYIYNNLVTRSNLNGGATATFNIYADGFDNNLSVYHNTFYESGTANAYVRVKYGQLYSKNNIYYSPTVDPYAYFVVSDGNIYSENDIFYGNGPPPSGTGYNYINEITTEPTFVDTSIDDFHLSVGDTAARDSGASESGDAGIPVKDLVNNDIIGTKRPQGLGYDIGAYEYISTTPCVDSDNDGYDDVSCGGTDCNDSNPNINPGVIEICDNGIDEDCNGQDLSCGTCSAADTSGEGVVDMIELIAYIGRWKNNDGVDMIDLIEAIGIWKGGGC